VSSFQLIKPEVWKEITVISRFSESVLSLSRTVIVVFFLHVFLNINDIFFDFLAAAGGVIAHRYDFIGKFFNIMSSKNDGLFDCEGDFWPK